jgi:hypothetical protein
MTASTRDRVRTATLVLLGLAAALASACVDAEVIEVGAGASQPLATTSTIVEADGTLDIGVATATPRGNTVALVDAAATEAGVHGLVEACAGSEAGEDVGVSLSFFALQLHDGTVVAPIEPQEAREPALRTQQIRPGTCTVGWLTFDVGDEQLREVRYLVFGSRSAMTRWEVGDLG